MNSLPADFLRLSARAGQDPLQVQGPGGNTSLKLQDLLWIKASGTLLAEAEHNAIFVPVRLAEALAQARGAGDGTCVSAVADSTLGLRPSIETTFHALIEWPVVFHTHSVATLVHAISAEGRAAAKTKLADLPVAFIPYCKPGRPLTALIGDNLLPSTQVWVLENHGLICAGPNLDAVAALMEEVERRLAMPVLVATVAPQNEPPAGYVWFAEAGALAQDARLCALATAGSYYPDHVVFLGPGMQMAGTNNTSPAVLVAGVGVAIRLDATPAQRAMVQCLCDVLTRLPPAWLPSALSEPQEAELLNWDAEKYRQALAARKAEPDKTVS